MVQEAQREQQSLWLAGGGSSQHLLFRLTGSKVAVRLTIAGEGFAAYFGDAGDASSKLAALATLKVAQEDGRVPGVPCCLACMSIGLDIWFYVGE
jgi:hypothetical protein